MAAGNVLPGGVEENPPEDALTSAAGGRERNLREPLLSLLLEGLPVGFAQVGEGAVGEFRAGHGEDIAELDEDGKVVGVSSGYCAPLRVYCYVRGGY